MYTTNPTKPQIESDQQHPQGLPPKLVAFLERIGRRIIKGSLLLSFRESNSSNDTSNQHTPIEIFYTYFFGEIEVHWISVAKDHNAEKWNKPFAADTKEEFNFKANHYAKNGEALYSMEDNRALDELNKFVDAMIDAYDKQEIRFYSSFNSNLYVLKSDVSWESEKKFLAIPCDEFTNEQIDTLRSAELPYFSNERAIAYLIGNTYRDYLFDSVEDLLNALNEKYDDFSYSHFLQIAVGTGLNN
ncbi:hypothetical protein DC915_RS01560 [Vibrio parahaemolyticus]|jgi:hypothetical protein|uniref:Uncharacterized protein n=2 Tax=Vibrio harveyi group TaxID=717610 RepID=A0A9Q3U9R7_VIBPH|nr:hypothetical protein [Vibrio parahaemolyticus]CAH1592513.1 hypothetical protein THF1C08_320019 [Vibrio jasicida]EJC7175927.1 hypothetical protein [Vibrio parahaemolyticus]EJE4724367.1 hypothetical protein [Vibrio parahaemolyticus]EJG0009659.1 hypothetical protein [Vibrio parahaemolyticus]EJO2025549.1 hypothetical protein [Vibrio parahaemolyticus]